MLCLPGADSIGFTRVPYRRAGKALPGKGEQPWGPDIHSSQIALRGREQVLKPLPKQKEKKTCHLKELPAGQEEASLRP